MTQNKTYSMLGIAWKAGCIAGGEFAVERAVKSGHAYLVIAAETASDNTKKKFENMCAYHEVPFYLFGDKEALGHAIGKEERAVVAVLAEEPAKAVKKSLGVDEGGENADAGR